jgi:hypothetical protein
MSGAQTVKNVSYTNTTLQSHANSLRQFQEIKNETQDNEELHLSMLNVSVKEPRCVQTATNSTINLQQLAAMS